MNILKKRDTKWFMRIPFVCILVAVIIFSIIKLLLDIHLYVFDIAIILGLSMVVAIAICGFFYAGLKIAAYSSITGCVAGIIYMAYVFMQPVEFKSIVGIVSGAQLAFTCFLVGINAQMLSYIFKRGRIRNDRKNRNCTQL